MSSKIDNIFIVNTPPSDELEQISKRMQNVVDSIDKEFTPIKHLFDGGLEMDLSIINTLTSVLFDKTFSRYVLDKKEKRRIVAFVLLRIENNLTENGVI